MRHLLILGFGLFGLGTPRAWELLSTGTKAWLSRLHFVGADTGFAAGDSGVVLRTTDGGVQWTRLAVGTVSSVVSMQVADSRNLWILAGDSIRKSTDAGTTWTSAPSPGPDPSALHFAHRDTGWIFSSNSKLFRTVNGGATWDSVYQGRFADKGAIESGSNALRFVNGRTGWLVNRSHSYVVPYPAATWDAGMLWKTQDGGSTWTLQYSGIAGLISLRARGPDTAWAVGGGPSSSNPHHGLPGSSGYSSEILRTVNGGATWIRYPFNFAKRFHSSSFIGATGYVAGDGGLLLRSSNGGESWVRQEPPTSDAFLAVEMRGLQVYVAGANGMLFRGDATVSVPAALTAPRARLFLDLERQDLLRYSLPYAARVTARLTDPLGRTLQVLHDATEAPGMHSLSWKPDGLAPGAYLLDFRAGGLRESRMIRVP